MAMALRASATQALARVPKGAPSRTTRTRATESMGGCDGKAGDPSLQVVTNVKVADKMSFMKKASEIVSRILGKPESYVAVSIDDEKPLIWGGTDDPAALATLHSIGGITKQTNAAVSKELSDLLFDLGIEPTRYYITFQDIPPDMIGYNGKTFAG